jgi:hypothetical protein
MAKEKNKMIGAPTPGALFLVFTKGPSDKTVGNWAPFNDAATISAIKTEINERLDRQLDAVVEKKNRFYFRHLNHGIEKIDESNKLNWARIHGMIVDLSCAQHDPENAAKLDWVAEELARVAPAYSRIGTGFLACLVKKVADVPNAIRRPAFRLRQPEDSDKLKDEIAVWLVDLSLGVFWGRESVDAELQRAAKEYFEKSLAGE